MKILQLCTRVPFPPVDGGSIAMYNVELALTGNNAELKVLAFNTVKQLVNIDQLDSDYKKISSIEAVYLDNHVKPFDAFLNLFSGQSYHVVRFIKKNFEDLLISTLEKNKYDIVQLESLFMIPYVDIIRKYSKAVIVLRTHNIEHFIWKRMAKNETAILRKWYLNFLAKRLKKFEIDSLNKVDAIVTLTNEDRRELISMGAKKPLFVSAVGIETGNYQPVSTVNNKVIFHIGAMDWLPNQEGILWFLEEVWPEIKMKYPDVHLKLAGKKMPSSFYKYNDRRCSVQEFVPDAVDFMATGEIMIVPLFSGSGMRVKIVEGLALGKAIISTGIGAEGIPVENGKEILIANSKAEFIAALDVLINDHRKVLELGKNAREFARQNFDNLEIGKLLLQFYTNLLQQ